MSPPSAPFRGRFRRFGAVLVLAALAVPLVLAGPAASAEQEGVVIRSVDTTGFPLVHLSAQVASPEVTVTDFEVRENGDLATIQVLPIAESALDVGIVLTIDTSAAMAESGALDAVKAAARQFVERRRPNEKIALVSFGDVPKTLVRFTDDNQRLLAGIDRLRGAGEPALWDGMREAGYLMASDRTLQPNLIVITGGVDGRSIYQPIDGRSAVVASRGPVYVLGVDASDEAEGSLRTLTSATGGSFRDVGAPSEVAAGVGAVQDSIQRQYVISWTSTSTAPVLDVILSFAGARVAASATVGTFSEGTAVSPNLVEPRDTLLSGNLARVIGLVLGSLAIALLAWSLAKLVFKEESTLSRMMRPYQGRRAESEQDEEESSGVGQTQLVQRAMAMTTEFAAKRGFLPRVEHALERSDLPFRAPEAMFFYAVGVTVAGLLLVVFLPFVLALAALAIVAILPPAAVNYLGSRRRRKFLGQLPDTLQLLSGSLRAGYSLMQGVEAVSKEVEDPMGQELRRVLVESRLGRPLEQSLDDAADRMASPDFAWAVMAIRIQREVGGNLSELLQTVADTMISRERLRREVRALTAEGRMSAIVLGFLPVGIGAAVYVINKPYISLLFEERVGQYMLGGATLLALLGFFWMKKTIEIEV